MKKKIKEVTELLESAESLLREIAEERTEFYDNKTDRWQESETGERYQEQTEIFETGADTVNDLFNEIAEME